MRGKAPAQLRLAGTVQVSYGGSGCRSLRMFVLVLGLGFMDIQIWYTSGTKITFQETYGDRYHRHERIVLAPPDSVPPALVRSTSFMI